MIAAMQTTNPTTILMIDPLRRSVKKLVIAIEETEIMTTIMVLRMIMTIMILGTTMTITILGMITTIMIPEKDPTTIVGRRKIDSHRAMMIPAITIATIVVTA
jgi:hypothetical protein